MECGVLPDFFIAMLEEQYGKEVSEKIIDEMLAKLEMAEDFEAETVEWICI